MGLSLPILSWGKVKESLQPSLLSPVLGLEPCLQLQAWQVPRTLLSSPPRPRPRSLSEAEQVTGSPGRPSRIDWPRHYLSEEGPSASLPGGSCNPRLQQGQDKIGFYKVSPLAPGDPSSWQCSSVGRMPSLDGLAQVTVQDSSLLFFI